MKSAISTIMTRDLVSVSPDQRLVDVKHIFEKENFHHHIPVVENGKLAGMISLIDFIYAIKNASLSDKDEAYYKLKVRDIMRSNPVTMSPASTIEEVSLKLAAGEVHAILIAEKKELKGIVSTADVIRYFLKKNAD